MKHLNKILILGHGIGRSAQLEHFALNIGAEIISLERAEQMTSVRLEKVMKEYEAQSVVFELPTSDVQYSSGSIIPEYIVPKVIGKPFKAPMTRRERRKQERGNNKRY